MCGYFDQEDGVHVERVVGVAVAVRGELGAHVCGGDDLEAQAGGCFEEVEEKMTGVETPVPRAPRTSHQIKLQTSALRTVHSVDSWHIVLQDAGLQDLLVARVEVDEPQVVGACQADASNAGIIGGEALLKEKFSKMAYLV